VRRSPFLIAIVLPLTLAKAFAQVTRPPVNVYDGFEGPSLSNPWDSPSLVASSATAEAS
jgi:hypothetical protein